MKHIYPTAQSRSLFYSLSLAVLPSLPLSSQPRYLPSTVVFLVHRYLATELICPLFSAPWICHCNKTFLYGLNDINDRSPKESDLWLSSPDEGSQAQACCYPGFSNISPFRVSKQQLGDELGHCNPQPDAITKMFTDSCLIKLCCFKKIEISFWRLCGISCGQLCHCPSVCCGELMKDFEKFIRKDIFWRSGKLKNAALQSLQRAFSC